jgi:Fe-S cluster assembly ATPase SufC
MLHISNLQVFVSEEPIFKGPMLNVPAGEVHATMGLGRGIIKRSGLILSSRTF